jgi:CheY-like chemotaxis protein
MSEQMTVLIVEDELFLRWNLADHLRGAGYLVAEVDSAQRAIDLCQSGTRIDILITDVQLNGVGNGWDVAKAFRALWDKIPVIYTSGNARDPGQTVPKSVFFHKPYQTNEVLRACQQLTA